MSDATSESPRNLSLAFVGVGNVGRRVWSDLEALRDRLRRDSIQFCVLGAATRTAGILSSKSAISLHDWQGFASSAKGASSNEILQWIASRPADVLIELSALDPRAGQPAIDYIRAAMRAGMHVVTANKGPEAFAFRELSAIARARGVAYRFESAVLDGMPVFRLPAAMPGCRAHGFEGILNSTSNLVISEMEDGSSYEEALARARALGITEADASWDMDGWDASIKTVVLANVLLGIEAAPHQVRRAGLSGISRHEIHRQKALGRHLRLIAGATRETGELFVEPRWFPATHLYASVRGTSNVLTVDFDLFGPLSLLEPSPGLRQTAYGVIADLLAVARGDFYAF